MVVGILGWFGFMEQNKNDNVTLFMTSTVKLIVIKIAVKNLVISKFSGFPQFN
jgi:hypothetical protein